MKKLFAIVAAMFCFCGFVSADSVDDLTKEPAVDTSERVFVPEDTHPDLHPVGGDKVQLQMRYIPSTDELRFYYICPNSRYEEGEAHRTILACLEDFQKQNDYYSYKHLRKAAAHYFKDNNKLTMVRYEGQVKFFR